MKHNDHLTMKFFGFSSVFFFLCFLFACGKNEVASSPNAAADKPMANQQPAQEVHYKQIEWTDLMPKDDLEALMNPPEYLDEIADGSTADVLDDKLKTRPKKP